MAIHIIGQLPSPEEIKSICPLTAEQKERKKIIDKAVANIITGRSDKLLLLIGPCSADYEDSVCDYMMRLAKVADKVSDKILIIPRIYTNKPRTTGDGYKGILHQPDPSRKADMKEGLIALRHMHLRVISETGFFSSDEMLYPDNLGYVDDILSYIAIGARSVENQQHRLTASGFDVPAGMKNPTSGDLGVMLNAIYAAQQSHEFIYRGEEAKTDGNPLAHAVLRGSVSKHGQCLANYHYEDLELLLNLYNERNIVNPAVIVDCNHNNSNKRFKEQIRIAKEVLHSRKANHDIYDFVKGIMIESYIEEGNQKIGDNCYGKSITDPCLGWNDTEKLIYDMADML